ELDQQLITAMQNTDAVTLTSIPKERLNSGNSEIRNWITTAGAVEHLKMQLIDYVPCDRSPAGTGSPMGFPQWVYPTIPRPDYDRKSASAACGRCSNVQDSHTRSQAGA